MSGNTNIPPEINKVISKELPLDPSMDVAAELAPYKVRLDSFEGPLDLLLHLIKKNEMDISKISISIITAQYLEYIDMMKVLNLEIAGDYLVMAATLAHIKSKSLLPEDSLPDQNVEEDETESEEALIKRLLEYQKFKDAGELLDQRPWVGRDVFTRNEKLPTIPSNELQPVNLFMLVELFYERLKKLPKIFVHEVTMERISVAERIQQILNGIESRLDKAIPFDELVQDAQTRYDVIVTFLALLEMVRVHLVGLAQADVFSTILITRGRSIHFTYTGGESVDAD
jgi:segregation and condensation protein A